MTTMLEIRDNNRWHPLHQAFFYSQRAGRQVLTYWRDGSESFFDQHHIDALKREGTVREIPTTV